jgi:hypothetical protein
MRRHIGCVVVLACLVHCRTTPENQEPQQARPLAHEPAHETIDVAFKLDPRLAGGTYGGERWVTALPYTSGAQPGRRAVVEAKAAVPDAVWVASDPGMVEVSPAKAGRVQIAVNHTGESTLKLTHGDAWTELRVRARSLGDRAMQVEIAESGGRP